MIDMKVRTIRIGRILYYKKNLMFIREFLISVAYLN